MQSRTRRFLLAGMLLCLTSLASCDLTLGPKVKTVYTILHPGKPIEILDAARVRGRVLDGTGDAVLQDVGGWVCMPPEHWEAVKRALEQKPAGK